MFLPHSKITQDALAIWQAGVDAVRADTVVRSQVVADRKQIHFQEQTWDLEPDSRLLIVGAGKAAFMMARGFLQAIEPLDESIERCGWINVPDGTTLGQLAEHVFAWEARPMGVNEPTLRVLEGTQRIVELVASATPRDTVVCLLTGGGSALLAAPIDGVSLNDKLAVIRTLSHRGANIEQLNLARRGLSLVKGGGLLRNCRARQWITFIISDVLGDPLESIASGPTIPNASPKPRDVLATLALFDPDRQAIPHAIYHSLEERLHHENPAIAISSTLSIHNCVLANNATAVDAAGIEAVRRGYAYWMQSSRTSEGAAEDIGRSLARQTLDLVDQRSIQCLIFGGEPSVVLPPAERRGRGGRNQQLVLAALDEIAKHRPSSELLKRVAILSGGTDGEDGPTDAAGAWLDHRVFQDMQLLQLDPQSYLERCDAYHFFEQTQSLIRTGPTHTNVCDIRVAILGRS